MAFFNSLRRKDLNTTFTWRSLHVLCQVGSFSFSFLFCVFVLKNVCLPFAFFVCVVVFFCVLLRFRFFFCVFVFMRFFLRSHVNGCRSRWISFSSLPCNRTLLFLRNQKHLLHTYFKRQSKYFLCIKALFIIYRLLYSAPMQFLLRLRLLRLRFFAFILRFRFFLRLHFSHGLLLQDVGCAITMRF